MSKFEKTITKILKESLGSQSYQYKIDFNRNIPSALIIADSGERYKWIAKMMTDGIGEGFWKVKYSPENPDLELFKTSVKIAKELVDTRGIDQLCFIPPKGANVVECLEIVLSQLDGFELHYNDMSHYSSDIYVKKKSLNSTKKPLHKRFFGR